MTKQTNVRGDPQDIFVTSLAPSYAFGTRMHVPDGRVFRRSQAGSTALVAGRTAQTTLPDVGLRNKLAGSSTGVNVVHVQLGNVAIGSASDKSRSDVPSTRRDSTRGPFINEYAEGLLYVVSGGGAGHVYRILTSEAADSTNNNMAVTLDAGSGIISFSANSTRVTLYKNFFKDLVLSQAPPSAPVIGVSPVAVPLGNHFWLQTQGAAAVLQQGDLQINLPIAASPETAGAVRHAVVVIPRDEVVGANQADHRTVALLNTRFQGDAHAGRLAPVTGLGVVPETSLGYVIDTGGYDGAQALVHLDIEV